MKQKQIKKLNKTFWQKLHDFFFPKDFWSELKEGTNIGNRIRDKAFEKAFNEGKKLRKKIDPNHKMKV